MCIDIAIIEINSVIPCSKQRMDSCVRAPPPGRATNKALIVCSSNMTAKAAFEMKKNIAYSFNLFFLSSSNLFIFC